MKAAAVLLLFFGCVSCGGNGNSASQSNSGPTVSLNGVWDFEFTNVPVGVSVGTITGSATITQTGSSLSGPMTLQTGLGGAIPCNGEATLTGSDMNNSSVSLQINEGAGCATQILNGGLNLSTCTMAGNNWTAVQPAQTCITPGPPPS